MSNLKYRPDIDGLRALAIIPVVLFHMGAAFVPGGYAGVDVFFVISGYLISLIIIKEQYTSSFSYKTFWLRRIKRIMPALLVMVILTSVAGYFLLYEPDVKSMGYQGVAAIFSYANIDFWRHAGSYWGGDAQSSPFLHAWSLSVEEQFYLFFPLLLITVLALLKTKITQVVAILTVCVLSFCLFIYGVLFHPSAAFYLLPSRAWELGLGSLLALVTYHYSLTTRYNNILSFLGISMVLFSYVFISGDGSISASLVFPVIGAALIIATAMSKGSIAHHVLSSKFMVAIGLVSYSLYLWHWPVLVLMREVFPLTGDLWVALYSIPIIAVLSMLSYRYVEKGLRYNKHAIYYIGGLFGISMMLSLMITNGKESSMNDSLYSRTSWFGGLYNVAPQTDFSDKKKQADLNLRMEGIYFPKPNHRPDVYKRGGVLKLYGGESPDIVVLGSSHALMWSSVIDQIAKELEVSVSFYAADGTPAFFNIPVTQQHETLFFSENEKFEFDEARLFFLRKWKPKLVIIASRWSSVSIERTVGLMDELAKIGSHVLLVEDPPVLYFGDKNAPQYLSHLGLKPNGSSQYIPAIRDDVYYRGSMLVRSLAAKYNNCDYLATEDLFLRGDKTWVLDKKDVLYIDDDHLSHNGAMKALNRFMKAIRFEP